MAKYQYNLGGFLINTYILMSTLLCSHLPIFYFSSLSAQTIGLLTSLGASKE